MASSQVYNDRIGKTSHIRSTTKHAVLLQCLPCSLKKTKGEHLLAWQLGRSWVDCHTTEVGLDAIGGVAILDEYSYLAVLVSGVGDSLHYLVVNYQYQRGPLHNQRDGILLPNRFNRGGRRNINN